MDLKKEEVLGKLSEPRTPTELARIFDKHHYTLEKFLRALKAEEPQVRSKRIGRGTVYWLEEPEPLKEMRRLVEETTEWTPREDLLVRLLEAGAESPEKAMCRREIPEGETKHLDGLINERRIVLTSEGEIYLTGLGKEIAKGARLVKEGV